ncbi:MAG: TrkH family potassium uptake protein [Candidatus Omnitrophota bacterium]
MILRPQLQDIKIIFYYLGKIVIALGFLLFIPAIIGFLYKEISPIFDFLIASEICFILGFFLTISCRTDKDLSWMHGMIIVALGWLIAMFLGAIPLYLSNHFTSYLDACFETMSGLATTGLVLVQDLDHLSLAHNFWRHFIMFLGGQGIVVAAIAFFAKEASGAFRMYVGEARDERILPNVIHTARFIWLVSFIYLVLGTICLGIVSLKIGLPANKAFFDGACIFMAAFDTGGFAPYQQNILYYHSFAFELVTLGFMILGAINFNLHYALWTGKRREIFDNIEIQFLSFTIISLFALVAIDLTRFALYPSIDSMFRKGFFSLISAHTGSGHSTLYAVQFVKEWQPLALIGLILAMSIGGSVCSTTGGVKELRLGIIWKGVTQEVRRMMLPQASNIITKFHHLKEMILEDSMLKMALLVSLFYVITFWVGAIVGVFYGYPLLLSMFESVSATANVGLSCGITTASMPAVLKILYILQMWAGRLEFICIFVLIGFFIALIKGK